MKNRKGITLIVLAVTIIVLLILAGVTIATLTGKSGLLERAKIAKEKAKIIFYMTFAFFLISLNFLVIFTCIIFTILV